MYRPITEWTLQKNEWKEEEGGDKQPYSPETYNAVLDDEGNRSSESEDTDEEFDWFNPREHTDDTYFTFINKNRETIEPGDQVFYCYGNRTNKFLLLNYGFCFPGNKYDSYEFPMRLDKPINEGFQPQIIDLGWQSNSNQKVRLKKD